MTFAWLFYRAGKHIAAFVAVLILAVYDFRFVPFIVIVYALSTLAKGFDRERPACRFDGCDGKYRKPWETD